MITVRVTNNEETNILGGLRESRQSTKQTNHHGQWPEVNIQEKRNTCIQHVLHVGILAVGREGINVCRTTTKRVDWREESIIINTYNNTKSCTATPKSPGARTD